MEITWGQAGDVGIELVKSKRGTKSPGFVWKVTSELYCLEHCKMGGGFRLLCGD